MKNGNDGERPAAWRRAGSAQSFRQACGLKGSESRNGFDFGPLWVETLARCLPEPWVLSGANPDGPGLAGIMRSLGGSYVLYRPFWLDETRLIRHRALVFARRVCSRIIRFNEQHHPGLGSIR